MLRHFLNQNLGFKYSNPNSWYSLSDDALLITPVIALYWGDLSFSKPKSWL